MAMEVGLLWQKCKTLLKNKSAFTRNAEKGNVLEKTNNTLDEW